MKGKRHTPEQIVRKLREADRLLAEGADVDAVCRHLEVSVQTYQRWRASSRRCGRRTCAAEGAGERECAAEADRRRAGARYRHAQGGGSGKLLSPERRRDRRRHECLPDRQASRLLAGVSKVVDPSCAGTAKVLMGTDLSSLLNTSAIRDEARLAVAPRREVVDGREECRGPRVQILFAHVPTAMQ